MSYTTHNFEDGQTLTAEKLNEMDNGIAAVNSESPTCLARITMTYSEMPNNLRDKTWYGSYKDDTPHRYIVVELWGIWDSTMRFAPDKKYGLDFGAYIKHPYIKFDGTFYTTASDYTSKTTEGQTIWRTYLINSPQSWCNVETFFPNTSSWTLEFSVGACVTKPVEDPVELNLFISDDSTCSISLRARNATDFILHPGDYAASYALGELCNYI